MANIRTIEMCWVNYTEMLQDELCGIMEKSTDELAELIEERIKSKPYVDGLSMEMDEYYDEDLRIYCGMTTIWTVSVDAPLGSIYPLFRQIASINEDLYLLVKVTDEWEKEKAYAIQGGSVTQPRQ